LRAICISDADGKHVRPLRYTVCRGRCSRNLSDPPDQLDWAGPRLLLYGSDLGIFAISLGRKPELLGRKPPAPFAADRAGDRVAAGFSTCPGCAGPVTVRAVPSGRLVGRLGGTRLDNIEPSLLPDGTQVVFVRDDADSSGRTKGIWIAAGDGSHLQQLARSGVNPFWSPAGDRIAYFVPSGTTRWAMRLVAPQGGASTTLLRSSPGTVFGWSPDGRRIAFDASGKLAVVEVATRTVRELLKLRRPYGSSSVAWSPDSRQLLVVWRPPTGSDCPSGLWRGPIDGAKPHLVHGC
jgi:WD40 repeat protein